METDHSGDDDGEEAQAESDEEGVSRRASQDGDRMETDQSGDEEGGARRPPRRRPRGAVAPVGHGNVELTQPVDLLGAYDRYCVP